MASAQPLHQGGDLPSGSMPSAPPPPPAPERIQPWWGGQTRSTLHDPMWLAANFHSSGWRKDLEHILKVYYKCNIDYFMEVDWSRIKEWFFDHFLSTRKPWSLRRPIHWTLWPTSRTSFIRPPASTWMASGASHGGSRGGATIMG